MEKANIIREIQRTAIGGIALGKNRFEQETGIKESDWYGLWVRWSEAVREAGCEPDQMNGAIPEKDLVQSLVSLTRQLGHVPVTTELRIAAKTVEGFPSKTTFAKRLGNKLSQASKVLEFCNTNPGHDDVASIWRAISVAATGAEESLTQSLPSKIGFVYLYRHGSRREYKIGKTYNPIRREGEIRLQLPEQLTPVHFIETDDPSGIERYWHTRFNSKRMEGEWFALTTEDVAAFKRWRKIN